MSMKSLIDIIESDKSALLNIFLKQIDQHSPSPYRFFILNTEEGLLRVKLWLDLLVRALHGEENIFYEDQRNAGYSRAMHDFSFDFVTQYYYSFQTALKIFLIKKTGKEELSVNFLNEYQKLNCILTQGISAGILAWIKIREEKILKKSSIINEFYYLSKKIISTTNLEKIIFLALDKLIKIFNVDACHILIVSNMDSNKKIFSRPHPLNKETRSVASILNKSFNLKKTILKYGNNIMTDDIKISELKKAVVCPIITHNRCYGSASLHNQNEDFKFNQDDLSNFYQILYLIALAIENSIMLNKIKTDHNKLKLLTSRLLSVQEEERQSLAFHLHDTLAQELVGISYNIQTCISKVEKSPQIVSDRLKSVLNDIDKAIDQTRNVMTMLRPDLLDNLGLVPALEKHVQNFVNDTGIIIHKNLEKIEKLSSETEICIFRVAQEALRNIYKHSEAKSASMSLYQEGQKIFLKIYDQGKGFDLNNKNIWLKEKGKMGLFSMIERVKSVGGSIKIKTENSAGCHIKCIIPMVKDQLGEKDTNLSCR
ncbi:MAG: sensor histidine kinase [Dissulfuribacterales bacterium]